MNTIAAELFAIHVHAEDVFEENPNQIVYKEQDVIRLLQQYGAELPVWDEAKPVELSPPIK